MEINILKKEKELFEQRSEEYKRTVKNLRDHLPGAPSTTSSRSSRSSRSSAGYRVRSKLEHKHPALPSAEVEAQSLSTADELEEAPVPTQSTTAVPATAAPLPDPSGFDSDDNQSGSPAEAPAAPAAAPAETAAIADTLSLDEPTVPSDTTSDKRPSTTPSSPPSPSTPDDTYRLVQHRKKRAKATTELDQCLVGSRDAPTRGSPMRQQGARRGSPRAPGLGNSHDPHR